MVDDEEHRGVELGSVAVGNFGADLDAALGVDHDDGGLDHVEGCVELTLVVGEAGHIEDVYLLATELGVHEGVLHGVAAVVLDVAIVADGVLAVHAATTVDEAAAEGHSLSHGSLARFGAAHEGDVTDVLSLINFHCYFLFILFLFHSLLRYSMSLARVRRHKRRRQRYELFLNYLRIIIKKRLPTTERRLEFIDGETVT